MKRRTRPRGPACNSVSVRNKTLTGFLLATLAAGVVACHSEASSTSARKSTLTILYNGCERCWGDVTRFMLFSPLVTGEGPLRGGQPRPALAERWEHSPDYREWTIHLRSGVRWDDGQPLTAHDIEFDVDLWRRPDVAHPGGAGIDSLVLIDSLTYRVFYSRPSTEPLNGWDVFYPKHKLETLDPKNMFNWDFWSHPVGSGPFRYVRHVPATLLEVEANPLFFGEKPKINRVVLKFGPPSVADLLAGQVDAVHDIEQSMVPKLKGDSRFRVYYQWIPYARVQLFWNAGNPLFRDVAVRRALTMAVDRKALRQVLDLPPDIPLTDGLFTARQFERRELTPAVPYDPAGAAELLRADGWRARSPGAPLERRGRPFRFQLIVPNGAWLGEPSKSAVFIQEQLRRIGVLMDIQPLDPTLVNKRLFAGNFDAAIYMSNGSPARDAALFGEKSPLGYHNDEMIQLLDSARQIADPDALDAIYARMSVLFHADLPAMFLYPKISTHVAHRRVRGLSGPYHADPVWFVKDLWLDDE